MCKAQNTGQPGFQLMTKTLLALPQTILIVEDEPRVGCNLARMLTQLGYSVLLCQQPIEAIQILEQEPELFAIVADYNLYGTLTGLDILASSRAYHPNACRILISALIVPEHDECRMPLICHTFLKKPFTWKQLEYALHTPQSMTQRLDDSRIPALFEH